MVCQYTHTFFWYWNANISFGHNYVCQGTVLSIYFILFLSIYWFVNILSWQYTFLPTYWYVNKFANYYKQLQRLPTESHTRTWDDVTDWRAGDGRQLPTHRARDMDGEATYARVTRHETLEWGSLIWLGHWLNSELVTDIAPRAALTWEWRFITIWHKWMICPCCCVLRFIKSCAKITLFRVTQI